MAAPAGKPIVLVPARLASTRLPNKPLAEIAGQPMIVQVWRRACEAEVGPVVVAAAEPEIVAAVESAGGRAVLTDPALPSGSDRIHQALQRVDPEGVHDVVVNVQGDLPTIDPAAIRAVLAPFAQAEPPEIATLAAEIREPAERTNPNVVKVACGFDGRSMARALYFSRTPIPWDQGDETVPLYHHIGLYAYRRAALDRFVALPPSPLEKRERLEQLRALEAGMRIEVVLVDTVPLGVDTPADLETARRILGRQ